MSGKTNASKAAHRATRKSRRQAGEDPEVPPPPVSGAANSLSVSDSSSETTDEFANPEIDTYILEDSLAIDTAIPAPTVPSIIAPTAPAPTAPSKPAPSAPAPTAPSDFAPSAPAPTAPSKFAPSAPAPTAPSDYASATSLPSSFLEDLHKRDIEFKSMLTSALVTLTERCSDSFVKIHQVSEKIDHEKIRSEERSSELERHLASLASVLRPSTTTAPPVPSHPGPSDSIPNDDAASTKDGSYHSNEDDSTDIHDDDPTPLEHVTSSTRTVSIFGKRYSTNPALWKIDEFAHYHYAVDQLTTVQVEATCPKSRHHPFHTYSVRLIDGSGSHTVRHDDLFLDADVDDMERNLSEFTEAFDQVDRKVRGLNPDLPDDLVYKFDRMKMENFKASTFTTAMASAALLDDQLPSIKQFYLDLSINLTAANKYTIQYLPAFSSISSALSLRDQVYPPSTFTYHARAKTHLDYIGLLIGQIFHRPAFTATAPLAKTHLDVVMHSDKTGWEMLEHLLRHTIPYLGATGFDVDAKIRELQARHGMRLSDFLSKALSICQSIRLSGITPSPNAILRHFISELMKCTNIMPLVAPVNRDLNSFISRLGCNAIFKNASIDSLATDLRNGFPPNTCLIVPSTPVVPQLTLSGDVAEQSMATPRTTGSPSYNRPQYAATQVQFADKPLVIDEETSPEEEPALLASGEEVDDMLNEMVPSVLDSLDFDPANPDAQNLVLAAMRANLKKAREPCQACGSTLHPTDSCRLRGEKFQPDWLRRQIQQVNSVLGDSPINPVEQSRPTPRKPAFAMSDKPFKSRPRSGNRNISAMEITGLSAAPPSDSLIDSDDDASASSDGVLQFAHMSTDTTHWTVTATDEACPDSTDESEPHPEPSASPSLELRSITSASELDATLDSITNQIEASIDNDKLAIDPQYAVLDMKNYDPSITSDPPVERDIANPMQVSDYSSFGYDEPLNC